MLLQCTPAQQSRFWSGVARVPADGCWEWTRYRSKNGYGQTSMWRRPWQAHRLAWTLTNGPIPPDRDVLHRCGNRACCRPDHLYLGTDKDNAADREAMGRTAWGDRNGGRLHPERRPRGERSGRRLHPERYWGERNSRAVLTAAQVSEIRARYAAGGLRYIDLALEYGVSKSLIGQIIQGTIWRHTEMPA